MRRYIVQRNRQREKVSKLTEQYNYLLQQPRPLEKRSELEVDGQLLMKRAQSNQMNENGVRRPTVEKLEEELEVANLECSAFEDICQIMVCNMLQNDIAKMKEGRVKHYKNTLSEMAILNIEEYNKVGMYYEKLMTINII